MSYMVTIASRGGIITAADSRANVYKNNTPIGIYDKAQKIFIANSRLVISTINNEFIGNKLLSTSLKEFILRTGKNLTIRNISSRIDDFLSANFKKDIRLQNQLFYFSGFYKGEPYRIVKKGSTEFIDKGYNIICPLRDEYAKALPDNTRGITKQESIKLATSIILDYQKHYVYKDGIHAWKRVGGPIDIAWLPKDPKSDARWIKKKRECKFYDIATFLVWARKRKNVRPLAPYTYDDLNKVLDLIQKKSS